MFAESTVVTGKLSWIPDVLRSAGMTVSGSSFESIPKDPATPLSVRF